MLEPRPVSRRDLLLLSAAGVLGAAAGGWLAGVAAAAGPLPRRKSCILLWMNGGPSQAHTFDIKPGREYKAIATSAPGIQISEYLPALAKQMHHCALLRGMSTGEAEHIRARYLMHTGYRQVGSAAYPALGCAVSAELGRPDAELPNFVTVDGGKDGNDANGPFRPVPAHLGPRHSPLHVADPARGVENLKPPGTLAELDERAALIAGANRRFLARASSPAGEAHASTYRRALGLLHSVKSQVFDLSREPARSRAAYGDTKFGRACLLARRLVEAGVPFVEVGLGGWDDHGGAARDVKRRSAYMDPAMSRLLIDLKERGLLDSTLVVWMGEFGRSPHDNGIAHYPRAWTTLLAGAGLKVGQAVGRTDKSGRTVEDRPVGAADFMATVFRALDIDPTRTYMTPDSRPVSLADRAGKPVKELFPSATEKKS